MTTATVRLLFEGVEKGRREGGGGIVHDGVAIPTGTKMQEVFMRFSHKLFERLALKIMQYGLTCA